MKSTDSLLLDLFLPGQPFLNKDIPARDRKILSSLYRQISSGYFLTENQGKLLVKIFKENINLLNFQEKDTTHLILNPIWSKSFRQIEQQKKIYLSTEDEKKIVLEFSYNKRIREQISKIVKDLEGGIAPTQGKKYFIPLTEKNIVILIKTFKNFKFDIDEKILNFYQEIDEILKNKKHHFDIDFLDNKNLKQELIKDIGEESIAERLFLHDRKIKYQYTISEKISNNDLTAKIAARNSARVFLNEKEHCLTNIIQSLVTLKRLPILFIFSGHEASDSIKDLENLANSLEKLNLTSNVGIYFRFDNVAESNKSFNELVTHLNFNKNLTSETKIVGLANNKLPKFIVKELWKPKSIISFSNNFKNNKTSVYCDNVDLTIFYNQQPPLGDIDAIV